MNRLYTLLFFLAMPAWATTNQIDFYWGRATPRSDAHASGTSDRIGSRGTDWSLDAMHKTGPRTHIGMSFGRFRSNDNLSYTFLPQATSALSSRVTSTLLLGRLDILPGPTYAIYGIAGVGYVQNSLKITAQPSTTWSDTGTTEERTLVDDSVNALGYAAGLGMDVNLTDRIVLGAEARYQGSTKKDFDLTPAGSALTGASSVYNEVNRLILALKIGVKY